MIQTTTRHPAGRLLMLCGVLATALGGSLTAQSPSFPTARMDTRRAQATRAELESTLLGIDSILNSPGYSSRLREAKRRESALIRERLTDGDLRVGDQVALLVEGETALSQIFPLGPGRILNLPGVGEIPMGGILRTEAEAHVRKHLGNFIRNPQVRVQTLIRMGIRGAVGQPGFFNVPAEYLVTDAIMAAGGPAGTADPNKTAIRRGGTMILGHAEVQEAMIQGTTLDQLNLRAGDEIIVDEEVVQRGRTIGIIGVISLITSLTYLTTRIFRF